MAKTRQQKEATLSDLGTELKSAKGVVFANFQGLNMKDSDELRTTCKKQQLRYIVTKKTLIRKALGDLGLSVDANVFDGGVSVIVGQNDEVAPAQVLAKFATTHELARIFGGILEGQFIDSSKVSQLAKLPSKLQLLGQLVGTMNAPVSGFVNVLAGNLRGLVTVLGAIKEKKTA